MQRAFSVGDLAVMTDNDGYDQLVRLEEDLGDELFCVRFRDGSRGWAAPGDEWGNLRSAEPEYSI